MGMVRQALRRQDLCSGTMGFSQNVGWEMGLGSPLQALTIILKQFQWNFSHFCHFGEISHNVSLEILNKYIIDSKIALYRMTNVPCQNKMDDFAISVFSPYQYFCHISTFSISYFWYIGTPNSPTREHDPQLSASVDKTNFILNNASSHANLIQ